MAVLATAAGCSDPAATPTGLPNTPPSALPNGQPRLLDGAVASASASGRTGFGFNGTASGFPKGIVFLTGGGSFVAASASNTVPDETTIVASGGGFRCIDGVAQGPLSGCATGEGVRWDTAQLLESTMFKCTLADGLKPASTGDGTVVLLADFYRAGNGNVESFTAQMIVSEKDLAPGIEGDQNIWIQGVGCGTAVVNFSK